MMPSVSQFDPNDPLYLEKMRLAAQKIAEDKAKQEAAKAVSKAEAVAGVASVEGQEALLNEQQNVSKAIPSDIPKPEPAKAVSGKRVFQQRTKGLTNIDKKA
jgi:hypothetical protein